MFDKTSRYFIARQAIEDIDPTRPREADEGKHEQKGASQSQAISASLAAARGFKAHKQRRRICTTNGVWQFASATDCASCTDRINRGAANAGPRASRWLCS